MKKKVIRCLLIFSFLIILGLVFYAETTHSQETIRNKTKIETVKPLLEIVYFISVPLLVIIGIIGLKQITVAKKDIFLRCKREAASLASMQCQRYSSEIIPLLNTLDKAMERENLPKYSGKIKNFNSKDLLDIPKEWVTKFLSTSVNVVQESCDALNALEAFAVYFVKGVADEEIAFSSVGQTYCYSIKRLYLLICVARDEEQPGYYENIVELYRIWSSKIEKFKLESLQKKIENKLDSLKTKDISPLGYNTQKS